MKRTRSFGPALLAGVLLFPACAHYSQEDGERLSNEVFALQTQLNALQRTVGRLEASEKRFQGSADQLHKDLSQVNKLFRRNGADFMEEIERMRGEFARLKGGVETFRERMSALEASSSKVQEELDLRFQNLQEQAKIASAQSEAAKQRAIRETARRERLLAKPDTFFKEVQKGIKNRSPTKARKLLRQFMIRAKEESRLRKHRGRAQFLIGETFFAEKKFQKAAAEYNAVRKNYPQSRWVPFALYKLGFCFEKLKLPDDARLFYKTVVDKYGRSGAARDARRRLQSLKSSK